MRQETNNEMDLLLRRLSRRQGVPVSDADSRIDSDHLDADELSSYAENVLPAASRARYTEHLAQCSRCREIVVQLSATVPIVAAKETVTAAASSGFRKFLASLFSPMVLRYAVPALGLIVAATIGFVYLRSSQERASVAQLEHYGEARPAVAESNQRVQDPQSTLSKQPRIESPSSDATRRLPAEEAKGAQPPPPPNAPPSVGAVREQTKTDTPAKIEAQTAANERPPKPAPTQTVDEIRIEVEGRRAAETGAAPGGDLARQKTLEAARDEEAKKTAAPASARAARSRSADTAAGATESTSNFRLDDSKEKDRDDGVIRSVGGRRFRKQSGVWVDTAYDSGSSIVNISRGSEQYRALVADEPGIKSIADQLDGTIIVVWKGRTYRIR